MTTSNQAAAAFVKAQAAFAPALKTHTNPAFKSRYADLSACIEAVLDALNSNGLAVMQRPKPCDKGVTVETVFVHESGEILHGGELSVPAAKQDPQGFGSALTYARRYGLMAACGIAPEDDDGNAATKATQQQRTPAQRQQQQNKGGQDMAQIVHRIAQQIDAGNAAQPASWLATLPEPKAQAIMSHLTPEQHDAITAAWPEVAA